MALTIQQIIDEADAIVPNEIALAMKVSWLNNPNSDFFNVVKIPKIARFNTVKDQATYTLPSDVRGKNIDLVNVGLLTHQDLDTDSVKPLQNFFTYDDSTKTLTLNPVPYDNGLSGIVRYHKIATTTFLSSNMNAVPDAPEEYHWTFVPALCEYICLAMNDPKASTFAAQYTSAWNVAAQNYQRGGAAS